MLLCVCWRTLHTRNFGQFLFFSSHLCHPSGSSIDSEQKAHRLHRSLITLPPRESINRRKHLKPFIKFSSSSLQKHFIQISLNWKAQQSTTCYKLSALTTLPSTSSKIPSSLRMTARTWFRAAMRKSRLKNSFPKCALAETQWKFYETFSPLQARR